ncbi:MAG: hypothetical protein ABR910_13580 [Acidobacteriaceae bacterium]
MKSFPHEWQAEVLAKPPLIAPARQFTYPHQVAGEEDAMARGALLVMVRPASGGAFLATCARGFADASMPTGIYSCPNPRELCALAGGYAYVIDTTAPERSTHIPLKPVAEVLPLAGHNLLIFAGFHSLLAWGRDGLAWQSARLSWEGLRITGVEGDTLRGLGWNMPADKEVEFTLDLRTGAHSGGGY